MKKMSCLMKLLVGISSIIILLFLFFYFLIYYNPFPEKVGAKDVRVEWTYKGENFTLEMTLYESINDFYEYETDKMFFLSEEEIHEEFQKIHKKDDSIKKIIDYLNSLKEKKGYSDDELVELASVFVQSIPYDDDSVESEDFDYEPRFPYQVLYDQTGICSGKTYLTNVLLQEMSYGTAVFFYDVPDSEIDHITAGVKCTETDSTESSGYCVAESTTTGNRIGIEPQVDDNGAAVTIEEIERAESGAGVYLDMEGLKNPVIYLKTNGKEYAGIANTMIVKSELAALYEKMTGTADTVNANTKEVDDLYLELESYKNAGNFAKYNSMVDSYNAKFYTTTDEVNMFNADVERFNALVEQIRNY